MPAWLPRSLKSDLDAENQRSEVKGLADEVRRQRREAAVIPSTVASPEPAQQVAAPAFDVGATMQKLGSYWSDQPEQEARNPITDAVSRLTSIWDDRPKQTPTPSGTPAAMPTAPGLVDATITSGPRPGQTLQPGETVGSVTLGDGASTGAKIDNRSRATFVQSAYPHMLKAAGGDHNLAQWMLAKAISENGDVGSGSDSFIGNNFGGIKGKGPTGKSFTARTWEMENGQRVYQDAEFAAFDTPEEGMGAFMNFLRNNERYHPALARYQQTGDARQLFQDINAAGYATNPRWWADVESILSNDVAPNVPQQTADARQSSMNAGAGLPPAASAAPAGPGSVPPPAGAGPTMMMRASFDQPADDAGPDGGGIPRDPRRFVPTPNIVPLGPALRGESTLDDHEYTTWRPNRDPYADVGEGGHSINQPVRPWTVPGTRNRPVPGGVSEWQDEPVQDPYGPFDPAERNRPVPGGVNEYGGGPERNRYPNIIRDEQQSALPPSVLRRWQQRTGGAPMTEEDIAQLRALGVIA